MQTAAGSVDNGGRQSQTDGLETITAVDQQRAVSNSNNVRIILNTRAYFSVYYYIKCVFLKAGCANIKKENVQH